MTRSWRNIRGEWLVCGIMLVISSGFLIGSFQYSPTAQRWPLVLSCTVIGLVLLYAVSALWTNSSFGDSERREAGAGDTQQPEEEDGTSLPEAAAHQINERAVAATGLSFVLLAILAYGVGFLLASAIYVAGYIPIAGYRKPLTIAVVTAGVAVSMYLLFGNLLNAPLTEGAWFEYDLYWLPL